MQNCKNCGMQIDTDIKVCPNCGVELDALPPKVQQAKDIAIEANRLWHSNNRQEAYKLCQEALQLDSENKTALYLLAFCYIEGVCVEQDYEHALFLINRVANAGRKRAKNIIKCYNEIGDAIWQVYKCGRAYFFSAIEQGHLIAQDILGLMYEKGEDIEQDKAMAFYWFNKSAERGYAPAQYSLGCCYNNGEGVAKDLEKAKYWWQKSASQGYEDAKNDLAKHFGQN
ncbi:MAG: tetratricopeptide repeat protein [Christensenellales bacterium]